MRNEVLYVTQETVFNIGGRFVDVVDATLGSHFGFGHFLFDQDLFQNLVFYLDLVNETLFFAEINDFLTCKWLMVQISKLLIFFGQVFIEIREQFLQSLVLNLQELHFALFLAYFSVVFKAASASCLHENLSTLRQLITNTFERNNFLCRKSQLCFKFSLVLDHIICCVNQFLLEGSLAISE